jgi:hypothetical protein
MRKEYKLMDRNLIRNFGKLIVTLDETVGKRFVRENKAKERSSSNEEKSLRFPPSNKAIFHPPEEKSFEELGDDNTIRYPGLKDKLFPHIAK